MARPQDVIRALILVLASLGLAFLFVPDSSAVPVLVCADPLRPGKCPDLTVLAGDTEISWFTDLRLFVGDDPATPENEADCAVREGLAQPGLRRLLFFATTILNKGDGALAIGQISQSPLATFDDCHRHWHLRDFVEYRLFDSRGAKAPLVVSAKAGFCVVDLRLMTRARGKWVDAGFDDPRWSTQTYNGCDDASMSGLSPGWADTYGTRVIGQWVDVTAVAPGRYTLQLVVNPDGLIEEESIRNNSASVEVVIE